MKRLLTITEAASYCGLSYSSFRPACPVAPVRVRPGLRGLRYDVKRLDEWIERLSGETTNAKVAPISPTDWLNKLDGPREDSRRQGVHEQG